MNITLHVWIDAPTHDLGGDAVKQASRYRRGDIVAVYLSSEIVEPPSPNSPLGFVHITGIPNGPSGRFNKIKSLLTSEIENPLLVPTPDPDFPGEFIQNQQVIRRRQWRIPPSILPAAKRNKLLSDREITVTWSQARPYVRKKIAFSQTDSSQDDETTELVDGDI